MPIGQMQLTPWDKPTSVNPVNEFLSSAVESYYKPQERSAGIGLKQAEANSKNAYANFTPAQIAATLLNSPSLRGVISPDQIKNLATFASNGLTNGMNRTYNNNYNNRPSLLDNIMSGLGFHGNNNNAPVQQGTINPPDQSQSVSPSGSVNNNSPAPAPAQAAPTIDSGMGQGPVPSSTINNIAKTMNIPGSSGGINAPAVNEAQEGALKATASGEATASVNQWKDRQDKNAIDSKSASDAIVQNNNILQSYQKLSPYERGPLFGGKVADYKAALGIISPEAQDFDRYIKNRAVTLTQGLSNGNLTGPQLEAGQSLKVTRQAHPETVRHAMAFDNGLQSRNIQRQSFDLKAQNLGLTPAQSDVLWTKYINDKPFWDPKTSSILHKNMDYSQYLTPQKISEVRGGYDPTTMLNYKYKDAKDFNVALNTLNPEARQQVLDEMKRRGWH